MKARSILSLALIFFSGAVMAQRTGYDAAIKKGLDQAKAARTDQQFSDASNYFERIAMTEKSKWLPEYYAAYYNFLTALTKMKTPKDADPVLDKALTQIEQANKIKSSESEILALKGEINYMKMAVDPQARYMSFLPLANRELDSAAKLNPQNPRVDYIRGSQSFYTPEQYGGGKAVAKPIVEKAMDKFKAFKPADELAPSWGWEQCKMLLDACKS